MNVRLVSAVVLVVALTGCANASSPAPTASTPAKKVEPPTSTVLYSYLGKEKSVNFVAEIKNPTDRTRFGVETTWKAYDADGVILGSATNARPPIPPHGSILYAGGGGELSGVGEKVTVEVTDEGGLTKKEPSKNVKVGDATFKRSANGDAWKDARTFEASVVVIALADIDAEDVNVWVVLRNKNDKVVGTGWSNGPGFVHEGLPDQMAAGDKARLTIDAAVPSGRPTTIEAFVSDDAADYSETTRR